MFLYPFFELFSRYNYICWQVLSISTIHFFGKTVIGLPALHEQKAGACEFREGVEQVGEMPSLEPRQRDGMFSAHELRDLSSCPRCSSEHRVRDIGGFMFSFWFSYFQSCV